MFRADCRAGPVKGPRMQLIATDILADMCGLSLVPLCSSLGIGVFLWLFGWWSHRFWVVLVTTVIAGLLGLNEAARLNAHPIFLSLLLALAAGVLALALVRLVAFAAGGIAGLLILQQIAPSFEQPVVGFLISGLLGLLLFRLWMMALTSFTGALLMMYAGLALANVGGAFDSIPWSEQRMPLLNWICGGIAFLGFTIQFLMDRGRNRREREESGESWSLFRLGRPKASKAA